MNVFFFSCQGQSRSAEAPWGLSRALGLTLPPPAAASAGAFQGLVHHAAALGSKGDIYSLVTPSFHNAHVLRVSLWGLCGLSDQKDR